MNRRLTALGFAAALMSALWATTLFAQSFSVDAATPGGLLPDVIYIPGPAPISPPAGPPIEVDCFSYISPIFPPDGVVFSVAMGSMGVALSAVNVEFLIGPGEQTADIFFAGAGVPLGTNIMLFDGDGTTPPGLGLIEPGSNIDGVDATAFPPLPAPATPVFFTISPATAGAPPYGPGASAAAIYMGALAAPYSLPGGLPAAVYAPPPVLGLVPLDNIDGLHYMEDGAPGATPGDVIYFSLALLSPSLAVGPLAGLSAADVFVVSPGGIPGLFIPGGFLGLLAGDNIDALSMHMPGAGVPVEISKFRIE